MKRKISKLQIFRFTTQLIFLILFPGLITLTFGELKQVYLMLYQDKFNFIQTLPQLIEILIIIPMTILFGRFFCGWFCSFGFLNDFIYLISSKIFKVKFKVDPMLNKALKYIKYLILAFIVLFMWTIGSTKFDTASPWDAFAQITQISQGITGNYLGFIILAFILLGAMFIERFFCRYLCPLGAVFSIISKVRIFKINKPTEKCGKCRICTNNCAMGIELYKHDKVRSGECINCLKCIDVCPRKNTQASILDENINSSLVSTAAVAAFAIIYSTSSALIGGGINNKALASGSYNDNNSSSYDTNAQLSGNYKDGTYTGVGRGYRPNLQVSVTIKSSKITNIEVISNNETPRFSRIPISQIPELIINSQSTNVDTVSGATRTSNGIIAAVEDALNQAQGGSSTPSGNSANNSPNYNNSTSQDNNGFSNNRQGYGSGNGYTDRRKH